MTDYRSFFLNKDPYDLEGTSAAFVRAVRENVRFQLRSNAPYREIVRRSGFRPEELRTEADLWKVPPLPSLYFKRNHIFSVPEEKFFIRATSSGTSGMKSVAGYDLKSMLFGAAMVLRHMKYYHLLSVIPTNYIVLGYEPSAHAGMGVVKTAYGATFLAPPLHREYALKDTGDDYRLNVRGVLRALAAYEKVGLPVRLIGFPSYTYYLAKLLDKKGIRLKLSPRSAVLLGGGWKKMSDKEVDENVLHELLNRTMGISPDRVHNFFSSVEHPILYHKCRCGHFHVPIYGRAIVRDPATLAPATDGTPGLLNLVTPYIESMPFVSVLTDDLAVLRRDDCACGLRGPHFELLGRAGAGQINICAVDSLQYLKA